MGTSADKFTGTWRLLACEGQWSDGRITRPYGDNPSGQLMYDGNGHFAGQIMARERPAFATGNLLKGSDAEVRAAFEGYVAYYGRYTVDEAEGLMIHEVEGSFFPNWTGERQVRRFAHQRRPGRPHCRSALGAGNLKIPSPLGGGLGWG